MRYRRVWSMAVFKGKLFAGTMPSGHVWSFEAGRNVTCDREFPLCWHHVAAVRDDNRLRLYVDGSLVSRSEPFKPEDFDLSNGSPLRIGILSSRFENSLRQLADKVAELKRPGGAKDKDLMLIEFAEARRRVFVPHDCVQEESSR